MCPFHISKHIFGDMRYTLNKYKLNNEIVEFNAIMPRLIDKYTVFL